MLSIKKRLAVAVASFAAGMPTQLLAQELTGIKCPSTASTLPPCSFDGTVDSTTLSQQVEIGIGKSENIYETSRVALDGRFSDYSGNSADAYYKFTSPSIRPYNGSSSLDQKPGQFSGPVTHTELVIRSINAKLDTSTGGAMGVTISSTPGAPLMNGNSVVMTGRYGQVDSRAVPFGSAEGIATVSVGSRGNLNLSTQVTSKEELTRLDEFGLITPMVSVTGGIAMNGSKVSSLADGVAAQDAVNKRQLDAESTARASADAELLKAINQFSSGAVPPENVLKAQLAAEATTREDADRQIGNQISTESQMRVDADARLNTSIATEAQTRAATDTQLTSALNTETSTRMQADLQTNQRIDVERDQREALASAVANETNARVAADVRLDARIDALGGRVDEIDSRLDRMEDHVRSGTAVALAMGGAAFLSDMKFNLTANVATYGGAHAGAMQVGALINPHVAINAGVASGFNKYGKTAARAGVTFGW